jgi:hypothetical protein
MEFVGTLVNAVVVTAVGAILAWLGKGKFEAQDRRIDRLEERLEHRIDGLQERLDRRIDGLQASVDAMRSDITQVALAVGARRRATNA